MGRTIEARGPLEQANGNKWSFHKSVGASEKAPPEWNKIPRTHVAIFPRARFRYEGLEFENWRICDSDQTSKRLSNFLLNAINQEIKDNHSRRAKEWENEKAILQQKLNQEKAKKIENVGFHTKINAIRDAMAFKYNLAISHRKVSCRNFLVVQKFY